MTSKRNEIALAATWLYRPIVQGSLAQIPWRQNSALPDHQKFVQFLTDQFNADERLWQSLETLRRLRHKLHPRMKAWKRKKLDLLDFAKAQPPKDCVGCWRAS
jgi:hypothetical protein